MWLNPCYYYLVGRCTAAQTVIRAGLQLPVVPACNSSFTLLFYRPSRYPNYLLALVHMPPLLRANCLPLCAADMITLDGRFRRLQHGFLPCGSAGRIIGKTLLRYC